jgi:hypothetical protein
MSCTHKSLLFYCTEGTESKGRTYEEDFDKIYFCSSKAQTAKGRRATKCVRLSFLVAFNCSNVRSTPLKSLPIRIQHQTPSCVQAFNEHSECHTRSGTDR